MIKYKVYREDNSVLPSIERDYTYHRRIVLVEAFAGWQKDVFDSMEEAVEAINNADLTFTDLVILPYVYLTK